MNHTGHDNWDGNHGGTKFDMYFFLGFMVVIVVASAVTWAAISLS